MKQLILHVGLHKTATSTIQASCYNNRTILEKRGIVYPRFLIENSLEINHSRAILSLFRDNPETYRVNIKKGVSSKEKIKTLNNYYMRTLESLCLSTDTIIISGEDISSLPREKLTLLHQYFQSFGFKVCVICFVRRPYASLCSRIQEMVKNGRGLLEDKSYLKNIKSQSPKIITMRDVFPDIEFHSFDEVIKNGNDPFQYFLKTIGINKLDEFKTITRNEGIGNLSTRLYSHLFNLYPHMIDKKMNIDRLDTPIEKYDDNPFLLTTSELEHVKPILDKENALFRTMLGEIYCDPLYKTSEKLRIDSQTAKKIYATLRLEKGPNHHLSCFINKHLYVPQIELH